jgi:hypothetical protein
VDTATTSITTSCPFVGRMRLQALRPAVISKLCRELAAHGGLDGRPLSATTVFHIHRTLRTALADAVRLLTAWPPTAAHGAASCHTSGGPP